MEHLRLTCRALSLFFSAALSRAALLMQQTGIRGLHTALFTALLLAPNTLFADSHLRKTEKNTTVKQIIFLPPQEEHHKPTQSGPERVMFKAFDIQVRIFPAIVNPGRVYVASPSHSFQIYLHLRTSTIHYHR